MNKENLKATAIQKAEDLICTLRMIDDDGFCYWIKDAVDKEESLIDIEEEKDD